MFGKKQSGDAGFVLADLYEDVNILRCARIEANEVIKSDAKENIELLNEIMKSLDNNSRYICFN